MELEDTRTRGNPVFDQLAATSARAREDGLSNEVINTRVGVHACTRRVRMYVCIYIYISRGLVTRRIITWKAPAPGASVDSFPVTMTTVLGERCDC